MLFSETWTRYGPGEIPNSMDREVLANESFYHSRVPGVESVLLSVTEKQDASFDVAFNDYVINVDPYQQDEENNYVTIVTYPDGSQALMAESAFVDYVTEGILIDPDAGDFSGAMTEVGYEIEFDPADSNGYWGGGGGGGSGGEPVFIDDAS